MSKAIVFGVLLTDGRTDWPGRNQLMNALAERTPVVFLQRSGSSGRLLHWRKPSLTQLGPNRYVLTDAFALRSHRLGRRLAFVTARIDGRWFRNTLRRHGMGDFVFWLTVNDPSLAIGISADRLVYDCMDPNFLPDGQARFDRNERMVGRRARVVFASARTLFERMHAVNPATYLLPNAAPARRWFGTRPDDDPPNPLRAGGRRVVGYLGTVDWRFDADVVAAAARALPTTAFVIAGRVNADQEDAIAPLRRLPNVVFTGQVDGPTGDAYLRGFDVGIIPFKQLPMNDAVNPVKMWMYLAAGLPVVSTAVAECLAHPLVDCAHSPAEFAEVVATALDTDDPALREQRTACARNNTWDDRAEQALSVLRSAGLWP